MADFLKTFTKRNTTKPAAQPDFVISGPQTFRPVRRRARFIGDLQLTLQGIHVSFDSEKGFQGLPKGIAVNKEGGVVLDELSGLNAEDVPESLRLGAPSNPAKPAATVRASGKKKGSGFAITGPTQFTHKLHVDEEYNWTGQDPTGAFRLLDKLGEGAYGSVYKAEAKDANMVLAIKMVLMGKDQGEIRKEIDILKKCKHENVVRYFGSATKDNYLWIMMDYCGAGSLQDQLKRLKQVQSPEMFLEKEISYVMYGSLQGLRYLHSLPIIHRDIKSGNILLTEDGRVKLADFGVSAQLNETLTRSKSFVGTALWMSPEVLEQEPYDQKADIWALGITAIELADGTPPHFSTNQMRAMFLIPQLPPPTFKQADKWSPACNAWLAKALKKDPRERPDAGTLLQDPFMLEAAKLLPELLLEVFSRAKGRASSSEPSEESPYNSLERKQELQRDGKGAHESPRPPSERKDNGAPNQTIGMSAKPKADNLTISNPQFMKNKKVGDPMLDQLIPIKNELEKERQRNAELATENAALKEKLKKAKKKLKESQKDLEAAEEDLDEVESRLAKLEGKMDKKSRKKKEKKKEDSSDSDDDASPPRPVSPTTPGATQGDRQAAQP